MKTQSLGIGYKERLARKRGKKCDRSARLAARRGNNGVWRKRGVCARSPRACVYSTGVHLDSVYVRRVVLIRRALQSSSPCQLLITLFMHVSFSLQPFLHAPPYVSSSLSVTFSGSPGQPVKCCNLSPSPSPRPPPHPTPYPRLPLVNHGANCRSRRRGGRG